MYTVFETPPSLGVVILNFWQIHYHYGATDSDEHCIFRRLFIILLAAVAGMAKEIQKVDVFQQFRRSAY